jgi:hypothetical protein
VRGFKLYINSYPIPKVDKHCPASTRCWPIRALSISSPKEEQRELVYGLVVFAAMMVLFTWNGWLDEFLLYWFLPSRFAVFFLALAFDYLPHMPKKATLQEDPFQATNNRMGHSTLKRSQSAI